MGIELKRRPTAEEIEQMCTAAEEAARRHLLSKVPLKRVSDFEVIVEAEGEKPLVLNIEVAIELDSGNLDLKSLVGDAAQVAFSAVESKARELDLCVDTLD